MTLQETGGPSLSEQITEARERAHNQADTAIEKLIKMADWLELRETSAGLARTAELLGSYTFNLMVMGRMKNGKSTLLNALMGGAEGAVPDGYGEGLMAVGDLPTTAILTAVEYSERPYVRVVSVDGSTEEWSLERYHRDSVLGYDEEENKRVFEQIKQFQIGYPAVLCRAGVVVVDSPGTDDTAVRTMLTRDAARACDAAIRPYRSDALLSQNEMEEDQAVRQGGTRVFTVINRWGGRQVDERLRAFVWSRYINGMLQGPAWSGQTLDDFADYDVFFVDGLEAFRAVSAGDRAAIERSGLTMLEARLGDFLTNERLQAHLQKHATTAVDLAGVIEEHIGQREAAIQADQHRLQAAYLAEQPKIAQVKARADKLPAIFARHRAQAELDLRASFRQAVAALRADLPGHLESTDLPSAGGLTEVLRQKKMMAEAAEEVTAFCTTRLDEWSQTEAPRLLEPIMRRLIEEVTAEVTEIGRQLDDINFRMSGWTVAVDGEGRLIGTTERVLSAVAGLFFGDISAAVTGGAGGWRGAAGGISGALGAAVLLSALGVTAGIVFFPVTLASAALAGMLMSRVSLDKRVKASVLAKADPALALLPEEGGDLVSAKVRELFAQAETEVTGEVRGFIDEQVHSIEAFVELNQRDQAEKDRQLRDLAKARGALAELAGTLKQAIAVAKQG